MAETVVIERMERVAIARINRPEALNALNTTVMAEMGDKLTALDADPGVGCIVVTGSEKAFAAGADIKEMQGQSFGSMFAADFFAAWDRVAAVRTPKIAAVSGFALGGGCELALMCDTIFCSDTAKFGQPEVKLGVMPGMGGSQRLTRLIGKSKAMDLILTGRMMDATEAERCGLVSRVVPAGKLMEEALAAAKIIAGYSKPSIQLAREAVDRALEVSLAEGLLFERRVFHALFATADQKEGMAAFIEKRPPVFSGK